MSGEHSHPEYDLAERLARLEAWVTEHEDQEPNPDPDPEPPPPDPDPDEPFPDNAHQATPTDNVRALALEHKNVELADGHYGDQQLGEGLHNCYIFSRTGNAIFDGQHQREGFQWGANGATLRNFHVRRYLKVTGTGGQASVEAKGEGTTYLNMEIGLVKNGAGFRLAGANRWINGRTYDCGQFGYTGSGSHGFIDGLYTYSCGNDIDPNPEIGPWITPPGSNQTSNGAGKVVLSDHWTIRNVVVEKCAQGPWFDIGNEPAVIQNIHAIDVPGSPVFIEANYGDSGYGGWEVEDITWVRSANKVRGQSPEAYPTPAGVLVTMTPDVTVRRAKGDGQELFTVGFIEKNHPQLDAGRDASRMGIDGEVVEDCDLAGGGFGGTTSNSQVRRGDPVFRNNRYSAGTYKWKGQTLTAAQFQALGHS